MIDNFGRNINYLRISVTKRCNLNCSYCGADCETGEGELSPEDIEKIARAFVKNGITKIRLTGGEPLVRKDICDIARRIGSIPEVNKLAITTNGILLGDKASQLKEAGISAVNISLDTTDKTQFKEITGADLLGRVFEGIDECEAIGLRPIRLNAVLIKGRNDDQAEKLINIARERKIDVRFIELMPFSDDGENESLIVTGDEILSRFPYLRPVAEGKSKFENSVARYYEGDGFKGRVGFITPMSDKFCSECNRIRLLSDGRVKACLGNDITVDLKPYLHDEEKLNQAVREAILSKPMEHKFSCGYGMSHGMNKIGG